MSDHREGLGPLADVVTGGPIDDPATADRANPRWAVDPSLRPEAQQLKNTDGSPNVMPPVESTTPAPGPIDGGTPQDQAAQELPVVPGTDNIRDGVDTGQPNPALAEGGEGSIGPGIVAGLTAPCAGVPPADVIVLRAAARRST